MKVFSVAFRGSKRGGGKKDDRPFPNGNGGGMMEESSAGTYIISSPPRYEPIFYRNNSAHTLQYAHNNNFSRPPRPSSISDIYRNGGSSISGGSSGGFTIYDEERFGGSSSGGFNRKRHGSYSNPESPKISLKNPFQRSRSSSGRTRSNSKSAHTFVSSENSANGFVWPTTIMPPNDGLSSGRNPKYEEPIYSEPLPPMSSQIREAERTTLRFYPNPNDPVQISNHIYEYLVSRRSDASTQSTSGRGPQPVMQPPPKPPHPNLVMTTTTTTSLSAAERRRRGSLGSSSSPSSGSSLSKGGGGGGAATDTGSQDSSGTYEWMYGERVSWLGSSISIMWGP